MVLFFYLCAYMRNNLFVFVLLLFATLFSGCRKSNFKIDFALDPDVWGNYQLAYYASDKKRGMWVNTTVPLQNGKFNLTGITVNPTLVYLSNGASSDLCFYVEAGDKITITGNSSDPKTWKITGNKLNEEWSAWRTEAAKKPVENLPDLVAEYVNKNPESQLSPLLLLTSFPRSERPEEFVKLWNSLADKEEAIRFAEIAGTPDFGAGSPFDMNANGQLRFNPSRRDIRSLALRRVGGHGDTLRWNPGVPAILYFYRRNSESHSEIIDTLKNLRKFRPDSLKAAIATISMDADSMKWRSAVTFDSVPKATDSWMPLGPNDSRARQLGVARTPYFIVIGKGGKQLYRGADCKKAAKSFRKAAGA